MAVSSSKRYPDGIQALHRLGVLPCAPELVIDALESLVVPQRRARIDEVIAARTGDVVAVVESLADPHNVSAVMRTCDGLGIQEVHVIEQSARIGISIRITRGCEKWMDVVRHEGAEACARSLKERGYAFYVADMRAARPLEEVARLPRVALAFGNEHLGVSDTLRSMADGAFAVPMRGMVESYNVSVAAAMALYETVRGREGSLAPQRALELRARFLMESVRGAEMVIERYLSERGLSR